MEVDEKAQELPEPTTEKGEYEELCAFVNPIAQPLAGRKVAKKLYKLIKKAAKEKNHLRQGIHDVHKALRRGETGLIVLAGKLLLFTSFRLTSCRSLLFWRVSLFPHFSTPAITSNRGKLVLMSIVQRSLSDGYQKRRRFHR